MKSPNYAESPKCFSIICVSIPVCTTVELPYVQNKLLHVIFISNKTMPDYIQLITYILCREHNSIQTLKKIGEKNFSFLI